jgi:hypothetical protein
MTKVAGTRTLLEPPTRAPRLDEVEAVTLVELALVLEALLAGVAVVVLLVELELCDDPPHPPIDRKTGRRPRKSSRRLTICSLEVDKEGRGDPTRCKPASDISRGGSSNTTPYSADCGS